jgi:archaellum component FlaC
MTTSNHTNVLLGDMNGKFDAIMEYVREIPDIKTRLSGVETRLNGVETRLSGVETRLSGVETRLRDVETGLHELREEQTYLRQGLFEELDDVERLKQLHPDFKHT